MIYLSFTLLCGFAKVANAESDELNPKETIAKITCKPQFDLKERVNIHVTDGEGRERSSFWQWLVLDDGKQNYRIHWGSPPLSRGLVSLNAHQIYTFTIATFLESNESTNKIIRIVKDGKVVYDVVDNKRVSDKLEQASPRKPSD